MRDVSDAVVDDTFLRVLEIVQEKDYTKIITEIIGD